MHPGDQIQIVTQPSFASLVSPRARVSTAPKLLAIGSPNFDLQLVDAEPSALRGSFAPLLQTSFEIDSVGRLFERAFEADPLVFEEGDATKEALQENVANTTHLHLATHGWFAPDAVKSMAETPAERAGSFSYLSAEARTAGLAPMTLCGLALAGANWEPGSSGRAMGILTAEELTSLDLSSCELAVLSACETNVGIRRAGQGIQSLQTALHAAGARAAITSLWKVDDAATRQLMEFFYMYLWRKNLPVGEALWRAKKDLRRSGQPLMNWSGWVLSGEVMNLPH